MVKGTLREDLLSKEIYKKTKINFQLPCPCKLRARSVILVTDLEDYSRPLRLGDSDVIVPCTRRMKKELKNKKQECLDDRNKLALDTLVRIKTFVEFTKQSLNYKESL